MKKEIRSIIQKRKKRFKVLVLAVAVMLCSVLPMMAMAKDYTLPSGYFNLSGWLAHNPGYNSEVIYPGDTFQGEGTDLATFRYYDYDGTLLEEVAGVSSHTVKEYAEFSGANPAGRTFGYWEVTYVYISAGMTSLVFFQAVEAVTYDIIYELDGGTNAATNPAVYAEGTGIASFAAPTKPYHEFAGWYADSAFTVAKGNVLPTETGAVTLYAKFIPRTYPIVYELDGGTNATNNPTEYQEGVGVASFAPATKDGYTFLGWYTDEYFGTPFTAIDAARVGGANLFAKWTKTTNAITYELDGGTNDGSNAETYTYGVGVAGLAPAVKDGYTFEGWFLQPEFIDEVTAISATEEGDITLYAKFVEIEEDDDDEDEEEEEPVVVPEPAPAPAPAKDTVPKTGEAAPIGALAALAASMGFLAVGKKKE